MPFVTFEGIDGSGKSSLLQKFAEHLRTQKVQVETTREPGGSVLGNELREILLRTKGTPPVPEAELLIYEADRAQHVATKIRPLLEKNFWVLSDRFYDSSVAFQGGGRRIRKEDVQWLNRFATGGLAPDLTVLVDCSYELSLERRKRREPDRFEKEDRAFHLAVREAYNKLAKEEPKRFFVVDGSKDLATLLTELVSEVKKRNLL